MARSRRRNGRCEFSTLLLAQRPIACLAVLPSAFMAALSLHAIRACQRRKPFGQTMPVGAFTALGAHKLMDRAIFEKYTLAPNACFMAQLVSLSAACLCMLVLRRSETPTRQQAGERLEEQWHGPPYWKSCDRNQRQMYIEVYKKT